MKKILLGLLVCAGFCACSNDDVVLNNPATSAIEGDSYISLAINLPTTGSTRAANDVYDDGLAAEYNVNDVTLYLLQGANEASAVVYTSYDLSKWSGKYDPDDDNITSRQQFTQQITRPSSGNLYALVVVNGNGVNIANGASLSDLQGTAVSMNVATIANVSGANFYMTNAPLWHGAKGGYTDPVTGATTISDPGVTTLAYIDSYKIYDTAAEAEANPATEIYVERGVAKVTVDGADAVSGIPGGIAATVEGFVLDLTNLTGYAVRNTTTGNNWWEYASSAATVQPYRFVGNEEVGADLYRTYWAIDPNYSTTLYTDGAEGSRNYPSSVSSLAGEAPTGTALTAADGASGAYCLENTFNVAHQNQDETTRAIVAVTLGNGSDFFVFEGVKSTLYTEEEILKEVIALFAANGDVQAAEKLWIGANTEDDLYSHFTASIDKSQGATDATVSIVASGLYADYFEGGEVPQVFSEAGIAAVVATINDEHEFSYYAGGVAYYPVLIKHFGDDLTPWSASDAVNGDSYPGSTAEQNWLGRYGVLRNNWYDVRVTAVNDIGSADVPTAYGEQDDPTQSWISVEINILSWAKRTQDVTL